MHGRLGGDSAGGSGATRESDEPPNPLIRFLAREMGLFSSLRLCWGKEIVGNRDFAEEMGATQPGGAGEEMLKCRDREQQLPVTALPGLQDGERCPVCPAQGGEGHGQVPLPRQVQAPQGTAVPGTGRGGGGTQGAKPQRSLHGVLVDGATGGQTTPLLCREGKGRQTPLAGWVSELQSPSANQFP